MILWYKRRRRKNALDRARREYDAQAKRMRLNWELLDLWYRRTPTAESRENLEQYIIDILGERP